MVETERRKVVRQRVLKAAKIISLDRKMVSDCSIRNISEAGAQLTVQNQISVPTEFLFLLARENKMCNARVLWRLGMMVGISFTSVMVPPPANLMSLRP